MYRSNQSLKERYYWLNNNWVCFPAKLQIQMTKEMREIKVELTKRTISISQ